MTTITFIVPVKNDATRLEQCLASIAANRRPGIDLKVIVADNGSTDDSRGVAKRAGTTLVVLPHVTVAELRNQAAQLASADLLAFVDADHVLSPSWASTAVDIFVDESVGAAGALYTSPPSGTWVQTTYGTLRGRTLGQAEVGWLPSGNLVVRRVAFQSIGGFDRSLEACEDVDFCERLRRAGWKVIGNERLVSIHSGDPPTLGALFRAERWRGRDNFRVTLRGKPRSRELIGLAIPIVFLVALVTLGLSPVAGLLGLSPSYVAVASALTLVTMGAARATRMAWRVRSTSPYFIVNAFVVAVVYDLARSLALVTRARHHRHA